MLQQGCGVATQGRTRLEQASPQLQGGQGGSGHTAEQARTHQEWKYFWGDVAPFKSMAGAHCAGVCKGLWSGVGKGGAFGVGGQRAVGECMKEARPARARCLRATHQELREQHGQEAPPAFYAQDAHRYPADDGHKGAAARHGGRRAEERWLGGAKREGAAAASQGTPLPLAETSRAPAIKRRKQPPQRPRHLQEREHADVLAQGCERRRGRGSVYELVCVRVCLCVCVCAYA